MAPEPANGRLATTRKGSAGSGTVRASPSTTVIPGVVREATPQRVGERRVELDRQHPRAAPPQVRGDVPGSRSDVDHEVARPDAGVIDQLPDELP